ncbi:MAG: UDP-N-acetylmuramoyl-L-alanine--D-glutamate ligase [Parcubacteria group bacterium]|nr:UDP-N-acetylmuramoyl-L-alanine--D-glutamate ligase [Parcubacteria group bacterium]
MSITELKNKKIAILGLGREGLATFRFLKKNKIKAEVLDAKFDKNYVNKLKNYDLIFRTPGFPRLHPKLLAAEKNGTLISSHIKLFFDLCPAKVIGVTGTKGKTTTVFLIYEILKSKYGKKVFTAGNFGKPALDTLPKLKRDSLVILELSSFQLQDLHKSPEVAVITNISVDHLDPGGKFRPASHQTAKEYFDAKMNIIKYQKRGDFAVIHASLKNKIKNLLPHGGRLITGDVKYEIKTKLKGRHNLENIALAAEVGRIFKVPEEKILKTVKKFKGVEHRLEFVAKINGVSFYNDSAATNPDAALAALKSFKQPTHLILGGSDKGLDYKKLAGYIVKHKNIKTVVLIGQLKNKIYKNFKIQILNFNSNSNFQLKKTKTLKEAVLTCFKNAGKNEIVILSPGAASFGMFENYAQRGREFKKIVSGLETKNERG